MVLARAQPILHRPPRRLRIDRAMRNLQIFIAPAKRRDWRGRVFRWNVPLEERVDIDSLHYEVRQSYRRLAFKCHPDRGGSKEAMATLNESYAVVKRWLSKRGAWERRNGHAIK